MRWLAMLVPLWTVAVSGQEAPLRFDIGADGDEAVLVAGHYQREGPAPASKMVIPKDSTFRWFQGDWAIKVPVIAGKPNRVTLRAWIPRLVRLSINGQAPRLLLGAGDQRLEYQLYLPAELTAAGEPVEIRGRSEMPPRAADARDQRELALLLDWIEVAAVDAVPADEGGSFVLPDNPEPDRPLTHRLRGTEMRPLVADVDDYVLQARLMRCNVMTIGPMNGRHETAFPTDIGTPAAGMQPDFIPNQVKALHDAGIAAIGWLVFNVQDLRQADQSTAAAKYPDYVMQYIDDPDRKSEGRVGMCIVSSPYRQLHGELVKQAAALGLDGVFFDGFYLGGIPHPSAAGCVCRWCNQAFLDDTGLTTPTKVDWSDPVFKRWVRWRNHKLLEVALEFRDTMREANPDLAVTCNYNLWPFANKGWETAIPMWSTDQFGVSQHAYSGRQDLEWVMLGFKSRLSHDLNPQHCDIWRTSQPVFKYEGTPEDIARHEHSMRSFMLSALSHGVTPWHGGHIGPPEAGIRVHEAVRERERFFSADELRHVGVLLSQNTFDFYGYPQGKLADYQDGVLGAWLLLTENHVPFRFVFDNQVEAGDLGDYRVLMLQNAAALSDAMAAQLERWVAGGGRLIVTGETGHLDEWGDPREADALAAIDGVVRLQGDPALAWLRRRDEAAGRALLDAVAAVPAPVRVSGPKDIAANATWGPERRELWVHLLNVSAFYPAGDTGFRGLGETPVYAPGDQASDAAVVVGGRVQRENRPVEGIELRAPGLKVKSARLGVADTPLERTADGAWRVPAIDIHDVVVLELE